MYEESKGFKVSLMGGFNREDVLQYIEQAAKESGERIAALQQKAELLRSERDELREKNEILSQKNADLLERLGEMTVADEKLQEAVAKHEQQAAADANSLRSVRARVRTLEQENASLAGQVGELAALCADFDASKKNLAEMELSAHRRAKEVEERAQYDAKRVRMQSAEVVTALKREIEAVCEQYRSGAEKARHLSEENNRRAEEAQAKIELVISTLDEVVVGELAADKPEGAERPKMQQILEMLTGRDERANT